MVKWQYSTISYLSEFFLFDSALWNVSKYTSTIENNDSKLLNSEIWVYNVHVPKA